MNVNRLTELLFSRKTMRFTFIYECFLNAIFYFSKYQVFQLEKLIFWKSKITLWKRLYMKPNLMNFIEFMFWTGHFPYEMPAFQNMIFIFKNVAVAQGILMILGVQIHVLETLLYKAGLHRSQRTNPRRDRAGGGRLPARAAADSPRGQRPTPRAGSGRLPAGVWCIPLGAQRLDLTTGSHVLETLLYEAESPQQTTQSAGEQTTFYVLAPQPPSPLPGTRRRCACSVNEFGCPANGFGSRRGKALPRSARAAAAAHPLTLIAGRRVIP